MKKQILLSALWAATLVAQAGVEPKVKPETLVSGHQYVLVNQAMSANQYMSRTSWDGALYFLPEADSKYATHAFTAQQNENGTWSFTIPGVETVETGEIDDEKTKERIDRMHKLNLHKLRIMPSFDTSNER